MKKLQWSWTASFIQDIPDTQPAGLTPVKKAIALIRQLAVRPGAEPVALVLTAMSVASVSLNFI
jgi:hypothetical protein